MLNLHTTFRVSIVASALVILALAFLIRRPIRNFDAFQDDSLAGSEKYWKFRPRHAESSGQPGNSAPHPLAGDADRALLAGNLPSAHELYERAISERPADGYSRFLLACLYDQADQPRTAIKLAEQLLQSNPTLPAAHVLERYLQKRVYDPLAEPSVAYLQALVELSRAPGYALLPNYDILHKMVRERLYDREPPRQSTPEHPDYRWTLQLLTAPDDQELAFTVLQESQRLELLLLAAGNLYQSAPIQNQFVLDSLIEDLRAAEPDNGYLALLQAAISAPEMFHPRLDYEVQGLDLAEGTRRALEEYFRCTEFNTHLPELGQLVADSYRASGYVFAELQVPPLEQFLLLGDPSFRDRLQFKAQQLLQQPSVNAELMVFAAIQTCRAWPQLSPSWQGDEDANRLAAEALIARAESRGMHTESLRQTAISLPPMPTLPESALGFLDNLQYPLPIPALHQSLAREYWVHPGRLAADWRTLERLR